MVVTSKAGSGLALLAVAGLSLTGLSSAQAGVTNFTDRPTFNAAVSPNVLETFTATGHSFISGVLNSSTNAPAIGITPGTIQPGVTYSATVNNPLEPQFNIDSGAGFSGGLLDTIGFADNPASALTVTFNNPTSGFGFDTNSKMGSSYKVTFNLADGTSTSETLNVANTLSLQFFGFQDTTGINSAVIAGSNVGNTNDNLGFAVDNFAFRSAPVPEASTSASMGLMLALGLSGLFIAKRKRAVSAK